MPPDSLINPFGITREEILDLAAQKIADEHGDMDHVNTLAQRLIKERVEQCFKETLTARINTALSEAMEKLLSTEIAPVNIWGEKCGPATTMRDAMSQRARDFWNVTVNDKGEPTDRYGAKMTKAEWLMKKITGEEFAKAVQQNLTNIVGAFKDSLREKATKDIYDHLNKILPVKTDMD